MAGLRLNWLGSPLLEIDGTPVNSDRRKAVALLAYLTIESGPQRRENLAGLFWPDYEQTNASAYLRRTLWEINQMIGAGWLSSERDIVTVARSDLLWIDSQEFTEIYLRWKSTPNRSDASWLAKLDQAAALYRGDFLNGLTLRDSPEFDTWQFNQRETFRIQYGEILAGLATGYCTLGEYEQALPWALRWAALEPLNELAHQGVMQVYALSGQRSAALRQYERCVELLEQELGVKPDRETTALYERIRAGEINAAARPAVIETIPVAEPELQPMINLPVISTPFIGREKELEDIANLLSNPECRLLTLVGPGGTGKTRLAIQAASQMEASFESGIYFISLAPLETIDAIIPAIARAVQFSFRTLSNDPRPPEDALAQLVCYLRQKHLLLVLDNWEHLVAGSNLASSLLSEVAGIKILATSRERLNLKEEWVYDVRGLAYPASGLSQHLDHYSAIQLFIQTAQRQRSGYQPDSSEIQCIAEICRAVQGMPLAIELAASWIRTLACQEIARQVSLNLDFLATTQRDLPERHRSLRAVFDHSWNLLGDEERAVYTRLSVFQGGFTLDAAAEVARAPFPVLAALVDKSLLNRTSTGRYELHEMLKQFATQHLAENEEEYRGTRDRHFDYFNTWLVHFWRALTGAGQRKAIDEIQVEFENLRRAWDWGIQCQEWGRMIPFSRVMFLFMDISGKMAYGIEDFRNGLAKVRMLAPVHPEDKELQYFYAILLGYNRAHLMTMDWYEKALELEREMYQLIKDLPPSSERAFALLLMSFGRETLPLEEALAHVQSSEKIFEQNGDVFSRALALGDWAGMVYYGTPGGSDEAVILFEKALQILKGSGDFWATTITLSGLARVRNNRGEYERSRELLLEALEIYKEIGDEWRAVDVNFSLGQNATWTGDYDKARDYFKNNLDFVQRMGYPIYYASNLDCLGYIEFLSRNYDEAMRYYQESLTIYQKAEEDRGVAITYNNLGDIAKARGDYHLARRYFEDANRLLTDDMDIWIRSIIVKNVGKIRFIFHEYSQAEFYLRKALNLSRRIDRIPDILDVYVTFAQIQALRGQVEKALRVLALVRVHYATTADLRVEAENQFLRLASHLDEEMVDRLRREGERLEIATVLVEDARQDRVEHRYKDSGWLV